ncbi:MAG: hypothetical protein AAGF56_00455 [Pseudomonadota bacterium]
MGQDWIIDVLADLRSFARKNDMPMLTAQLEEAARVALVEMTSAAHRPSLLTRGDGSDNLDASEGTVRR